VVVAVVQAVNFAQPTVTVRRTYAHARGRRYNHLTIFLLQECQV
jgi:hypothetical protein